MDLSPRRTRAQRKQQQLQAETATPTQTTAATSPPKATGTRPIYYQIPNLASYRARPGRLPRKPDNRWTKLPGAEHALLLHKQDLLDQQSATREASIPEDFKKHSSAVWSTLVFAREEAGTAVLIRRDGLILTCAHCVAETRDEFDSENAKDRVFWLLLSSGRVVSAKCIAWDPVRDLALLGVVAAAYFLPTTILASSAASTATGSGDENDTENSAKRRIPMGEPLIRTFPHVALAESSPAVDAPLVCVGHPGSEDLETSRRGVKTGYDVLHVSTGAFRGIAEGQDLQDNEDIGALMHDSWTYWGHSGAPLLDRKTGKLVGLHSSWDDETCMRRGVAIEAIWEFLRLCGVALGSQMCEPPAYDCI